MGRKAGLPVLFYPTEHTSIYWCRFTINGTRYRFSTGCSDVGEATAEAQRLYAETALGRGPSARRRTRYTACPSGPLELLVAEYIVWTRANGKADSYVVKQEMHFRAHFLPRWNRLDKITAPAIEGYKVERSTSAKLTTVYKELVTLSRFLRWCRKQGHIDALPDFDRVKPQTDYRPPNLSPEDVASLLAEIPDRHTHHNRRPAREFFTVQWAQAMRPGEVMTLRWQDVDLERKRLTIQPQHDKARQGRTLGLAKEALAVLEEMAKAPHLPTARIFDRVTFRESLRLAADRAGLGHITPHHLRHARLSELASSTRDVAAVQFMAGHRNLSTTDRYVRSRTERTEEMLAQLDSDNLKRSRLTKRRRRNAAKK